MTTTWAGGGVLLSWSISVASDAVALRSSSLGERSR